MRFHRLSMSCLFVVGLMAIGCGDNLTLDTKENSTEAPTTISDTVTITGRMLPPGVIPQIIVIRNGTDFTNATVDEAGWYIISELPPGTYSLQVIANGFFTDISISNLELNAGEPYEADLVILQAQTQAATLLGRVVDKSTEGPLPDAEVQVECSTGVCAPLSAVSDQEGKFSIEIWSRLGANINVRKLGYRTLPIQVQALEPGGKKDLKMIKLERLER